MLTANIRMIGSGITVLLLLAQVIVQMKMWISMEPYTEVGQIYRWNFQLILLLKREIAGMEVVITCMTP
tara:strand:- start:143 stop:349 length:207 start_codon:yes stop_codon:yes gene_type:complete